MALCQQHTFPNEILIARHTFIDVGPPNDFYELITVTNDKTDLIAERALITPAIDACALPKVEISRAIFPSSMNKLLENRDPCDIPQKELRKERQRCKNCLVFSGADISMQMACGGSNRTIRMDILDRDIFDKAPNTPSQTSWTMAVMNTLDQALGPGALEKPLFDLSDRAHTPPSNSKILQGLESGKFDHVFQLNKPLSEFVHEAEQLPSLPNVILTEISPTVPIQAELPKYPPIARVAHLEGTISVEFDVLPDGRTKHVSFPEGSMKMFQATTTDAIGKWIFPITSEGYRERATLSFNLNCRSTHNSH